MKKQTNKKEKKIIKSVKKLVKTKKNIQTKKHPGNPKNKELFDKFVDTATRLGIWNLSPTAFSTKYGVPRGTVAGWKKSFIEDFGIPQVEQSSKEFNLMAEAALRMVGNLLGRVQGKKEVVFTLFEEFIDKKTGKKLKRTSVVKEKVPYSLGEKTMVADSFSKLLKNHTEFLESYKYKEKVANKVELSGDINVKGYVGFSPEDWEKNLKLANVEEAEQIKDGTKN